MKQNVIVLSVTRYQITDDDTKKVTNEGCTVRYLLAETLAPYEDTFYSVKGIVPAKGTMPYSYYETFQTVPGLYEATFDNKVDSQGRAALKPTAFTLISGFQNPKLNLKPAT